MQRLGARFGRPICARIHTRNARNGPRMPLRAVELQPLDLTGVETEDSQTSARSGGPQRERSQGRSSSTRSSPYGRPLLGEVEAEIGDASLRSSTRSFKKSWPSLAEVKAEARTTEEQVAPRSPSPKANKGLQLHGRRRVRRGWPGAIDSPSKRPAVICAQPLGRVKWRDLEIHQQHGFSCFLDLHDPGEQSVSSLERLADESRSFDECVAHLWFTDADFLVERRQLQSELQAPAAPASRLQVAQRVSGGLMRVGRAATSLSGRPPKILSARTCSRQSLCKHKHVPTMRSFSWPSSASGKQSRVSI